MPLLSGGLDVLGFLRRERAAGWIPYETPNLFVQRNIHTGEVRTQPRARSVFRHVIVPIALSIAGGILTGGTVNALGLPWYGHLAAGFGLGQLKTGFGFRVALGLTAPLVGAGVAFARATQDPVKAVTVGALYYAGRFALSAQPSLVPAFGFGYAFRAGHSTGKWLRDWLTN